MTEINQDFAKWLQAELDARGWSQADLARASGLSTAHIARLLAGGRGVGMKAIAAIAGAFNLNPEVVLREARDDTTSSPQVRRRGRVEVLLSKLDELEQEEILAMIETRVKLKDRRDAMDELRVKLFAIPPERKDLLMDVVEEWFTRNGVVSGRQSK